MATGDGGRRSRRGCGAQFPHSPRQNAGERRRFRLCSATGQLPPQEAE
jgi:hypothetical protein